jgi:hypothetical protein
MIGLFYPVRPVAAGGGFLDEFPAVRVAGSEFRRTMFHDVVESIQDRDGLGQFVAARVGVAAERIQCGGLVPGGEPSPCGL